LKILSGLAVDNKTAEVLDLRFHYTKDQCRV